MPERRFPPPWTVEEGTKAFASATPGGQYISLPVENDLPPYSAAAIANWFLERADRDKVLLDPMKLQKLIYFAHGWYLALTGKPLIKEHPEAWEFGPVIPSIYHEFKNFGRNPITKRASILLFPGERVLKNILDARIVTPTIDRDDADTQKFLEKIWEVYGHLSGIQLSNMTHDPNGAWHKAWDMARGRHGYDISDDLIKNEFAEKSKRAA